MPPDRTSPRHDPLPAALGLLLALLVALAAHGAAAVPGLPFTEDFTDTALRDQEHTDADWSTVEGALLLGPADPTQDPFGTATPGRPISDDQDQSTAVVLGDVNGDGHLDVVVSNCNGPNRLYLNSGGPDPFAGVAGLDITGDMDYTRALDLGDVDGDGDLDLVVGNTEQPDGSGPTRLYFNNGSQADPFADAAVSDIPNALFETKAVALRDIDGDGDLDLVAAAFEGQTWLYLNNGTADPFSDHIAHPVSQGDAQTKAMALGDVDNDGDLDVVLGIENQPNALFLNNGSTHPFSDTVAIPITLDADPTRALALGDLDGDGDLDLVAANGIDDSEVVFPNKLYLNLDPATPFSGTVGLTVTADADPTWALALGDVDGDADLDLVVGNFVDPEGYANKLYLNNGTADPFSGTVAITVSTHISFTKGMALGDMDWDGDLDLVTANWKERNQLYLNEGTADRLAGGGAGLYHTAHGRAASLRVNAESTAIPNATLTVTATLPANTGVTWWLSNNGGGQWFLVRPGVNFEFPTLGADLRWRAELGSLSPLLSPRVDELRIVRERYPLFLPLVVRSTGE
jgi:hypothetical protein